MPEKISTKESVKFSSPEEEIAFLREQVAKKESELEVKGEKKKEEHIIQEEVKKYSAIRPEEVLDPEYKLDETETEGIVLNLAPEAHDEQISELFGILNEKGVRNTLSVVEKMNNPHIEDDLHRFLVQYIKEGHMVPDLKKGGMLWQSLHMTLYEIVLPEVRDENTQQKPLKELLSSMEQFYAGMLSISGEQKASQSHFTFEIAVAEDSSEIILYAAIPNYKKNLFEKQILSIFPDAQIYEQKNDYNIFVEKGVSLGSYGTLLKKSIFPLKTYEQFDYDPLNVILNTFSKIEKKGAGASIQIIFRSEGDKYTSLYKKALKELQRGVPPEKALDVPFTFGHAFIKTAKDIFINKKTFNEKDDATPEHIDQTLVENIQHKLDTPIIAVNIRLFSSAETKNRAEDILYHLESAFNQFTNTHGNQLKFNRFTKKQLPKVLKEFSFREFSDKYTLPLSIKELTSLMHLPAQGIQSSPQFKQSKAGTSAAPMHLPQEGTFLGTNHYRNVETKAYLTKEDRLRHLYVIGQTGTGKTTFLKNMIAQDIAQGEGVCMIDPHGTDIVDVLGMIPEERYDDVIYFDPSYTKRSFALNMLEYDPAFPEQKTFVVNELFSIFQKLYGNVPESMGPMFEQYFRNATMLVLEDPASGSTLLDVSRVLSDARFRELKLSHCNNPVISQFWREIATKAGGESSLANIVPYITSKFDVFTANDYMRPLIAQEKSSFNFRQIMDERKILLVNLAKGRLGDINSNLIGLIIVGKILMAALSRVDSIGNPSSGEIPPFYLYIDEFQNVTTDSISTILSEARKYKLSLTVAHQFIAQLNDKIRDAVFGNVGSIVSFRVGSEDAELLEKQFMPVFNANDLMNIDNRNAYVRLLAHGKPVKTFNIEIPPPPKINSDKIEQLKNLSYEKYGRDREEVEKIIREKYHKKAL